MSATETKPVTLVERVQLALELTEFTDPSDLAKWVSDSMTDEQKLEGFAQLLPNFVSVQMSTNGLHAVQKWSGKPVKDGEVKEAAQGIKKQGTPWFKQADNWGKKRLSTGTQGVWVFWEDFTLEMASAKIADLSKRVDTMNQSIQKYELIKNFLLKEDVKRVGDLSVSAKKSLEDALGAIPED